MSMIKSKRKIETQKNRIYNHYHHVSSATFDQFLDFLELEVFMRDGSLCTSGLMQCTTIGRVIFAILYCYDTFHNLFP